MNRKFTDRTARGSPSLASAVVLQKENGSTTENTSTSGVVAITIDGMTGFGIDKRTTYV